VWFIGGKKKAAANLNSPQRQIRVPLVRARYDAAQTTPENYNHWAMADAFSPDLAMTPAVRLILRNRSRYEVANNSYAKGIINTLANDCIGTGPRLHVQTPNEKLNRLIEQAFMAWAEEINLAEKLLTVRSGRAVDGESFGILVQNRGLNSDIKLDVKLVEPEQVTTPWSQMPIGIPNHADGMEFDSDMNPIAYYVLNRHPYDVSMLTPLAYKRIDAKYIMHWFRMERAGQHRGVPEITPALPLFAQLRRYTQAVLGAAETAADFAAVLYTDAPADGAAAITPMDIVELEKRMATVMPAGWKLGQIEATQPMTTYMEFVKAILNEIARCLNMPFNIAAGNSSQYNYASGRLDHQMYFKSIAVDQASLVRVFLNPIFAAWMNEAILISDLIPPGLRNKPVPHKWFFDGAEHVDPTKEAEADAINLQNNTTTLAEIYAADGKFWRDEIDQRATEYEYCKSKGLPMSQPLPKVQPDSQDEEKPNGKNQAD
jgi:lambda family phage portal protein